MAEKKPLLRCEIPGCKFVTDKDLTYGGQLKQLKRHWRENEFKFKWIQWNYDPEEVEYQMATGMSIIQSLWLELDQITEPALAEYAEYQKWKAGQDASPWSTDMVEDLRRQLDMANKFKTGRGLAMAIKAMSHPYFDTADEVVAHAVERIKAKQRGESILTPGTGHGEAADRAWYAARHGQTLPDCDGRSEPVKVAPSAPAQDAPEFGKPKRPLPGTTGVVPAAPVPQELSQLDGETQVVSRLDGETRVVLDDKTADGIRDALAKGFDPARLAGLYNLTVEQVVALKAGV